MAEKEWIGATRGGRDPEVVYWHVVLGPFKAYHEALRAATPIHAEHESDYGVRIEGVDDEGVVRRVII